MLYPLYHHVLHHIFFWSLTDAVVYENVALGKKATLILMPPWNEIPNKIIDGNDLSHIYVVPSGNPEKWATIIIDLEATYTIVAVRIMILGKGLGKFGDFSSPIFAWVMQL